jgi:NADPH-dependent 2,4-dienoyl-CoA reductase/sulfur reductase-like enzyme
VRERLASQTNRSVARGRVKSTLDRIVIVGGGAAGFAAAEMLRRKGFESRLTILSSDSSLPCDRPNLSKDYLAGKAPEEWLLLKDAEFYRDRGIDIRLDTPVNAIHPRRREVRTSAGETLHYDALLLATGADPIRPSVPGFMRDNVYTLRSIRDAQALIAAAVQAKTVVVAGASFIGLEVAASLRVRGLAVHVVAPDGIPMERRLGRELGRRILEVHEENGVHFHLKRKVEDFDGTRVLMSDGGELSADMLVLGIGVRPNVSLARQAGIEVDDGVLVDSRLQTRTRGIFAAGDIARYPDETHGGSLRVEHWVVAERQGQVAAVNMLGESLPYRHVPFFWSNHYDLAIRYVGHAAKWERTELAGSVEDDDCTVRYLLDDRVIAAASIGRDHENLELELTLEQGIPALRCARSGAKISAAAQAR